MSAAAIPPRTWRQDQAESTRLAWAFAISVALHLLFFGGYQLGRQFRWWENAHWPAWLRPIQKLAETVKKKTVVAQPLQPHEPPLLFVEVNPAQEAAEPPKNPKFYSNRNSVAANPEADKNTDTPKITGEQTHVVKTEDVPRNKFTPLQPTPPVPRAQEAQEELKPKPTPPKGDLALGKPEPKPEPDPGQATHRRPRLLRDVPQYADNRLAGQKMKQEGGVSRHLALASLDAKATPYGDYDYRFIAAVQQKWYALLDERDYSSEGRGKVVLQFQLHADGRITNLKMTENTVSAVLGLICEQAIEDPAPYEKWSSEMRLNLEDPRKVQFTFYYD